MLAYSHLFVLARNEGTSKSSVRKFIVRALFSVPPPSKVKFAWSFPFFTPFLAVKFRELFRFGHPNPGKRSTRKVSLKFHATFHDACGREKRREMSLCTSAGYLLWQFRVSTKISYADLFWRPEPMCFLTVSSRPCMETNPHSSLRTPFAGHCLGALWGGKPCPAELSEGLNRVLRTLSGDPPPPILQTPSAGHCLDTHGELRLKITHACAPWSCSCGSQVWWLKLGCLSLASVDQDAWKSSFGSHWYHEDQIPGKYTKMTRNTVVLVPWRPKFLEKTVVCGHHEDQHPWKIL